VRTDAVRLSVVVPTRGTRELTLRCLGSLGDSVAGGVEVVVVDDGSGDGTAEAVRDRFPAARLLRHAAARGFTASASDGLRLCRGDLLLLLNSDAEAEPGTLPGLVEAFDADPCLGVASPRLVDTDRRPQWSGGAFPNIAWLFLLASGLPAALRAAPGYDRLRPPRPAPAARVDWVAGTAMAIRRRTWDEAGPFDDRYRLYAQDLDFCSRARSAGWRVRVVEEARVVHVGGATVGSLPGATAGRTHPALLWTDLLLWAEKWRGREWALAASRGLAAGARLRLLARAAARPLASRRGLAARKRDTEAYREGLAALRLWREGRRPQG
jgi:GT2 family glycosyltransferase